MKFFTNRFVENFCHNWIGNNSIKFRKKIIKKIIENQKSALSMAKHFELMCDPTTNLINSHFFVLFCLKNYMARY